MSLELFFVFCILFDLTVKTIFLGLSYLRFLSKGTNYEGHIDISIPKPDNKEKVQLAKSEVEDAQKEQLAK